VARPGPIRCSTARNGPGEEKRGDARSRKPGATATGSSSLKQRSASDEFVRLQIAATCPPKETGGVQEEGPHRVGRPRIGAWGSGRQPEKMVWDTGRREHRRRGSTFLGLTLAARAVHDQKLRPLKDARTIRARGHVHEHAMSWPQEARSASRTPMLRVPWSRGGGRSVKS